MELEIFKSSFGYYNLRTNGGKPTEEMTNYLKQNGYRWSSHNNCWYPATPEAKEKNLHEDFVTEFQKRFFEANSEVQEETERAKRFAQNNEIISARNIENVVEEISIEQLAELVRQRAELDRKIASIKNVRDKNGNKIDISSEQAKDFFLEVNGLQGNTETVKEEVIPEEKKEIELSADELETAKRFIPEMEYSTLLDNATHGEESEFFKQKIKHVADMGRTIYENRNGASYNAETKLHDKGFLHYFIGSTDWYICEVDDDNVGFGFVILNGDTQNAEYGLIDLNEVTTLNIRGFIQTELDIYIDDSVPMEHAIIKKYPELKNTLIEEQNEIENDNDYAAGLADWIIQYGLNESAEQENYAVSYEDILENTDTPAEWLDAHIDLINAALAAHNDNELLEYNPDENEAKEFNLYFCSNSDEMGENTLFKQDDKGRWVRKSEDELKEEFAKKVDWQREEQFGFTGNEGLFSVSYSFIVKDTAEFSQFADFEPIENLSAEKAVKLYSELREKGMDAGIALSIPGDSIFGEWAAEGISIVTEAEGKANFGILGDTFITQLKEADERSRNYINAYKELYEAFEASNIPVVRPDFVFEKENELFGVYIEAENGEMMSPEQLRQWNEEQKMQHSQDIELDELAEGKQIISEIIDSVPTFNINGTAYTQETIEALLEEDIQAVFRELVPEPYIAGIRLYKNPEKDGKISLLVQYGTEPAEGNWREDSLFNVIAEENLTFNGIPVDVNPITPEKSGTIEQYLERLEKLGVESENEAIVKQAEQLTSKKDIKAIREQCREILQKSDSEITEADKAILAQYEGAGGLNEENRTNAGILNEFYTPNNLVEKVWKIVDAYAPNAKTVLEPSAGVGKFANNRPNNEFTMHELDETSARINKILHPEANIIQGAYQKQFFDEGERFRNLTYVQPKYDVVIGNPPYGTYNDKYKGLGEGKEFDRYEEYFISKGLDALKDENSIMAFVVPSGFLNTAIDKQKEIISSKGHLIDAYRLPEGTFPTTEVGTDIIIMQNLDKIKKSLKYGEDISKGMAEGVALDELSNGNWFKQHPEKILGEVKTRSNRFGKEEEYVAVHEGLTVQDELNRIDEHLKEFISSPMKDLFQSELNLKIEQIKENKVDTDYAPKFPAYMENRFTLEQNHPDGWAVGKNMWVIWDNLLQHSGRSGGFFNTEEGIAAGNKELNEIIESVKKSETEALEKVYEGNGAYTCQLFSDYSGYGSTTTRHEMLFASAKENSHGSIIDAVGVRESEVGTIRSYAKDFANRNNFAADSLLIAFNPTDTRKDANKQWTELSILAKEKNISFVYQDGETESRYAFALDYAHKHNLPCFLLDNEISRKIAHDIESVTFYKDYEDLINKVNAIAEEQTVSAAVQKADRHVSVENEPVKTKSVRPRKEKWNIAKSKGEVMTAEEFSRFYGRDFDEREFPIWAATNWEGKIDRSKLSFDEENFLHESKNYVEIEPGEFTHRVLFESGNIASKIELYKRKLSLIANSEEESRTAEIYKENIAALEKVACPKIPMERLHFGVNSTLAEEFTIEHLNSAGEVEKLNLQESFILWAKGESWAEATDKNYYYRGGIDFATANISQEDLPENVSWHDIVEYIDKNPVKAERVSTWRKSEEEISADKAQKVALEKELKEKEQALPKILEKETLKMKEKKILLPSVAQQRKQLTEDIEKNLRPMSEVEPEIRTLRFEQMLNFKWEKGEISQEEKDLYSSVGYKRYYKWLDGEIENLQETETDISIVELEKTESVEIGTERNDEKSETFRSVVPAEDNPVQKELSLFDDQYIEGLVQENEKFRVYPNNHQLITYTEDSGIDDKREYATLSEAQEEGKAFMEKWQLDKASNGYVIFNKETKQIESSVGYFPVEQVFSRDVLLASGYKVYAARGAFQETKISEISDAAKQRLEEQNSSKNHIDSHISFTSLSRDDEIER